VIAVLVITSYSLGVVEAVGFSIYQNISPPLSVKSRGVVLSVAHSHYLTLETIVVTLTNHSSAPIYLPEIVAVSMSGANNGMLCWESAVHYQSAGSWEAIESPCWTPVGCPGGTSQGYPEPGAVGAVAPGESIVLDSYDGDASYPPLSPGAYRFSVTYSPTPFQIQNPWQWVTANSVTLTTTAVTLSSAWWMPPWYHQYRECPVRE
jgi:hypothetical protein